MPTDQCRQRTTEPASTSIEPRRPEFEVPDGTWTKDAAHTGSLASPFLASMGGGLTNTFSSLAERFGLLIDTVESRTIGYESYIRVVPLGGGGGSRKPPPAPIMWALVRLLPALRRRTAAARQAFESGVLDGLPGRWENEWKTEFRARNEAQRAVDLVPLDDRALLDALASARTLLADGTRVHFDLFMPYLVGLHGLVAECERALGWDTAQTMRLLTGHSVASSAPTGALQDVARSAAARPAAAAAIADRSPGVGDRLHAVAPDVGRALDDWVREWGHRTLDHEPAAPTFAEQPELVAHLLRESLTRVGRAETSGGTENASASASLAEARRRLAGDDRERFERALDAARRVSPLREDNVHLCGTMPMASVRRVALEIGRRLAERRQLAAAADVFLCALPEVEAGLLGGASDLRPTVERRRAEMAWVEEHPGPERYGEPAGAPPDMSALPRHARRINRALLWAMEQEFSGAVAGTAVRGVAASPGTHTGPVRVVVDEDDFFDIQDGDVLVCRITTTSWGPLMGVAGAIVCDSGGAFSHTAVIARELGLPAVLGTGNATRVLTSGEIVTVDGGAGVVEPTP